MKQQIKQPSSFCIWVNWYLWGREGKKERVRVKAQAREWEARNGPLMCLLCWYVWACVRMDVLCVRLCWTSAVCFYLVCTSMFVSVLLGVYISVFASVCVQQCVSLYACESVCACVCYVCVCTIFMWDCLYLYLY